MKLTLFLCFWVSVLFSAFSQTDPQSQAHGARSQGMGNLKLFVDDSWTVFNNVGALDRLEQSEISVSVDQRFGLKELSTLSFSGALKNEFATIGLGISRFGGDLFNQQIFGIGVSNTLGIVSLGAKIDWFQTQIEGFGSGHSLVFSLGGIAELSPVFFLGAHISNLTQSKVSKHSEQRLPTLVQLGLSYFPSEPLRIHSELEKDVDLPPVFKLGLEYRLAEWILLRTGINSNPSRVSFGLGIRKDLFGLDYAYGQNSALGRTHHFSLSLKL
ncbi:hypothetical protein [Algoriphagus sp. AK58]|uniref:hypothetical protein n=1 Tax=Algoriphagus sp. AK58 TaxID=1406877 RepID=UPI00164FECFE|nr:hypothetical protein [Algoriphagus sp. AK58]MBC6368584.1 hypothetical protein [Algoriphagus sp. AK58]